MAVPCPLQRRRSRPLFLLIVLLGSALVAAGCVGNGARPPGRAAELSPPVRVTLPNGLKLIVQEHRAADIVAIYLWVAIGVRDERPDQLGYSHFQEHMLFKGTDRWGPGHIDRSVEGVGGRANALTSFDYTTFFTTLPADRLEPAVQTLSEMAFRSIFDPVEVDRERKVIFEEARVEQDTPRTAMIRQLYALAFAGTPYAHPLLGTPETLNAATPERLRAYYGLHYTPSNMVLVVVGPVQPARVRAIVERAFGSQPNSGFVRGPAPSVPPMSGRISRDVERPEQQAMLGMAWIAPKGNDASGYAVDLLTKIIGGTESSRLVQSLRDQDHLVQSVRMSYHALAGAGIVTLWATMEPKDLAAVEAAVLDEIARIQEHGVTEEERQLAVTQAEARYAFDRETTEGLAFAYGIAEVTWSLDEELRYVEALNAITRAELQDAARRWLSTTSFVRIAFAPKQARP